MPPSNCTACRTQGELAQVSPANSISQANECWALSHCGVVCHQYTVHPRLCYSNVWPLSTPLSHFSSGHKHKKEKRSIYRGPLKFQLCSHNRRFSPAHSVDMNGPWVLCLTLQMFPKAFMQWLLEWSFLSLLKTHQTKLLRVDDSLGLRWDQRISTSSKFSGEADTVPQGKLRASELRCTGC
jgi:hypothetical protein